jgi:DNA-binding protein H-NS
MAKKAKRRGRPPGSKNKKVGRPSGKANGSVTSMSFDDLKAYIADLQGILASKIQEQRTSLERQLADLGDYVGAKVGGKRRGRPPGVKTAKAGTRAKPAPKYQSKKDKSQKWSGRGMTPVWMRDEMKGTKLTKDSFLISK